MSDPNDLDREQNLPEEPTPADDEGQPRGDETPGVPAKKLPLIGSQRDPAAYRKVKPGRPLGRERKEDEPAATPPAPPPAVPPAAPPAPSVPIAAEPVAPTVPVAPPPSLEPVAPSPPVVAAVPPRNETPAAPAPAAPEAPAEEAGQDEGRGRRGRGDRRGPRRNREEKKLDLGPAFTRSVEVPNIRQRLSDDLEAELEAAMAELSLDEVIAGSSTVAATPILEPDAKQTAKVVAVQREDVFVELGGREQGILPLITFSEPPQPGQMLDVVVVRFNREEGLYELRLPHVASTVDDWSSISEGMLVEARVTGHNTGGLECEVNHLRGFIPISQIALYRVENLAEFLEQKFLCVVVEANPERRNLVLSRRAVLEREKEEAREKLLETLTPGKIVEGVIRKIMDFGAFVDLGGVDGLLHVSQLSWGRVRHPSDVLQEGQRIVVRIEKIDRETGKIGLGYKDLMESPWASAGQKYQPNTRARGRVVKLMEFGAFVELEPGVEGLVHISELSHKRVARVGDVLKEGDEIDVAVLAVDEGSKRISLSLKNLEAQPEAEPSAVKPEEPPAPPPKPKKPTGPLKGGVRSPGSEGNRFGLKW